MSTEQYLADRMFGKRPEPRVGFKENAAYLVQELAKLVAVIIVFLAVAIPIYNAGKEDAREKFFRQLSRIAEDHQLLQEFIQEAGY